MDVISKTKKNTTTTNNKQKKKRQSKVSLWLVVQSLRVKEEKDQTGSTVCACFLLHLRINGAKPVAVVPADRQEGREGVPGTAEPSPLDTRGPAGERRGGVEWRGGGAGSRCNR